MKNKREFFGVLFSILICIFLVVFIVQATTTISTNIVTGGTVAVGGAAAATEFSVIGTASISEDLWASGSVQFGGGEGTGTLSYSRFGTGTTDHALSDADDLLITGLLEVDATASFDDLVSVSSSGIQLDDGPQIFGYAASQSGACTAGDIYIESGTATIAICSSDSVWSPLSEQ